LIIGREDHAGAHLDAFIGAAVVQYVGRVVEKLADAVAAEIAHDGTALAFGVALDGRADRAGAGAGADRRYAAHQAFMRDFQQPLGGALDGADRIHAARIAMPAVENVGHVDVDDVAVPERLGVRNAVADDMIDRGAGRFGVAAIVQGRGQGPLIHAKFENKPVDRFGGHAGRHNARQFVEAARGQVAGLAHAGEGFLAVEPDLAGVSRGRRCSVEIGDHRWQSGLVGRVSDLAPLIWHCKA
jgi:hypothetical protein